MHAAICNLSHESNISFFPCRHIGKDIGRSESCRIHQYAAFVSLAIQYDAYGPINTWDADDVSELKYIIGKLYTIQYNINCKNVSQLS